MRMATLQATKIREALQKAKHVGRVEEAVIIDGCSLVLQNLTTDDYNAIGAELEGLEDVEYLHAFQQAHVARSIVELGDQDLRNVDFVEDEVPAGKVLLSASLPKALAEELLKKIQASGGEGSISPDGEARLVRLERYEWIRSRILSGWGREALTVAWRKFAEVLASADEKAKNGIQFKIPDESSEERYRRLLGEMKEVEEDLPSELVQTILDEAGYMSKSSKEELEAAEQKLRNMASSQEEPEKEAPPPPVQKPQAAQKPQAEAAAPTQAGPDPQELMRRRQPLNRQAVAPPVPQTQTKTRVQPAGEAAPVPEQLRRAAQANNAILGRAAQIAALEGAVDPSLTAEPSPPRIPRSEEVAELAQRASEVDGQRVAGITDQPPVVGINPRFRPPPR
jgi:hypothetical protein